MYALINNLILKIFFVSEEKLLKFHIVQQSQISSANICYMCMCVCLFVLAYLIKKFFET